MSNFNPGDIVELVSEPGIDLVINTVEQGGYRCVYYNHISGQIEYTETIVHQALKALKPINKEES